MPKSKANKILVIRLSAMGDVAMTLPVIKTLSENYPDLRITVLTRPFFSPIFEPLEGVSVFTADLKGVHKGLPGLWKLFLELSAGDFDAVADLHNVLRTKVLKLFFTLKALPVVQIDKGRAQKKALTSLQNKKFQTLETTHQRYVRVFEKLGYNVNLEQATPLKKQVLSAEVRELLGQDHKLWIGVAPFAAYPGKQYPQGHMKEVLTRLEKTAKYKIILFGSSAQKQELNKLGAGLENGINIAGKLQFGEELALISNLDLMLSMDSANAHLAANFGIPVVTLWGLTHPYAGFYPFGQDLSNALLADRNQYPLIPTSVYGNKMPKGYEKAMETIHPQAVVAKIGEILESH